MAAVVGFALAPLAAADSGRYVNANVEVPGLVGAGIAICQVDPAPGVSAVCDLDCAGAGAACTVSNDNPLDAYSICWDSDGDGIDDVCAGPFTGAVAFGFKGSIDVFIEANGTTGEISTADP